MKLQYAASFLAGSAMANWDQIQKDFGSVYNNSAVTPQTITPSDMGLINEYGCWCFFEAEQKQGRSHPVDLIDSFCKRLHDGYECAIIDAAAMGETCVPWAIDYNSGIGSGIPDMGMDIEDLRQECRNQNPDVGCAQWTCMIEGYFVQTLFLSFTHGTTINEANRHAMGFDFEEGCPINKGIKSEKECCSEHPVRFPYKTYGGARACCDTHTYNAGILQCCGDGVVRMTCP